MASFDRVLGREVDPVDQGAVAASEIDHLDHGIGDHDLGVLTGDRRVSQLERRLGAPSDRTSPNPQRVFDRIAPIAPRRIITTAPSPQAKAPPHRRKECDLSLLLPDTELRLGVFRRVLARIPARNPDQVHVGILDLR